MVLPFFGKKPAPAGSTAPRSRRGSSAGGAQLSLSGLPRGGNVRNDSSTLDFTIAGGDLKRILAQCADKVHVEEGVDEMAPPAEEAAILFAHGGDDEARSVLEHALETTYNTEARFNLWQMLLDLMRLTGQREHFESLSLGFATEFERSPPAWHDLSSQADRVSAEPKVQTINLSGHLGGQAAAQFAQLIQIAMRAGALRIDLARLSGVDDAGAELLLRAVRGLRRAKVRLALGGAIHLVNLLDGLVSSGRRANQPLWLLLLEVLQYTDQQDRFEELAVDYAMTFEESPPSWEPPLAVTASQTGAEPLATVARSYVLEGEIIGPNTDVLRKITSFAADKTMVEVDCSRLRRMDFVSAGTLFNIVSQLHNQGRLIVLTGVNSMVAALMQVMGLHQVARIELHG